MIGQRTKVLGEHVQETLNAGIRIARHHDCHVPGVVQEEAAVFVLDNRLRIPCTSRRFMSWRMEKWSGARVSATAASAGRDKLEANVASVLVPVLRRQPIVLHNAEREERLLK
jgi:hypothetical protein